MRSSIFVGMLSFIMGISLISCAQQPKVATSKEAIQTADALLSVEEKVRYLVKEANAFINSKQFEEAVKTAKYVLSKLDSNSQEAKSIIEKAQTEIKKLAEQKLEEAKSGLKDKIGSFGQ